MYSFSSLYDDANGQDICVIDKLPLKDEKPLNSSDKYIVRKLNCLYVTNKGIQNHTDIVRLYVICTCNMDDLYYLCFRDLNNH